MDNSKENLDKLNNERENTKKNNVFAYITKEVSGPMEKYQLLIF